MRSGGQGRSSPFSFRNVMVTDLQRWQTFGADLNRFGLIARDRRPIDVTEVDATCEILSVGITADGETDTMTEPQGHHPSPFTEEVSTA